MKLVKIIGVAVLLGCSCNSYSQDLPPVKIQLKNLITYFSGKWAGSGHFANGKDISSVITFTTPLDSAWLVGTHIDNPPNQYKAMSMWGADIMTGKLISQIFDNFGGQRLFETQGWGGKTLILTRAYERKDGVKAFERFTYQVIDKQHFNLRYEVSGDGLTWRMGDELLYTKTN